MDLRAIIFDVNGTLIDIETDESQDKIYRAISRFLNYQGLVISAAELQERYFKLLSQQRRASQEPYPEFDVVALWRELLAEQASVSSSRVPADKLEQLPLFLAELHRALARKRLERYPDVREVLHDLSTRYKLGVVSDAQSAYAVPELETVGLGGIFSTIIVSGDHGFRKPDPRLFAMALDALGVLPEQAIYVGNDMYCDVFGAQQAGMSAVFWPTQFGKKEYQNVAPDYIIYNFAQLREAVTFLL